MNSYLILTRFKYEIALNCVSPILNWRKSLPPLGKVRMGAKTPAHQRLNCTNAIFQFLDIALDAPLIWFVRTFTIGFKGYDGDEYEATSGTASLRRQAQGSPRKPHGESRRTG